MIRPIEYQFNFSGSGRVRFRSTSSDAAEIRERDFLIDASAIASLSGAPIDSFFADWIDIAAAIYVADRLAPRRNQYDAGSGLQWRRDLRLTISVREQATWSGATEELERALNFLTEDRWSFRFKSSPELVLASYETQGVLFDARTRPSHVALFSGGLDSLAGFLGQFGSSDDSVALVSGVSNPRQAAGQKFQIRELRRRLLVNVEHVPVRHTLHEARHVNREESSQRARSFLYLSLGAIVALRSGVSTLHVFENGIGALNLPFDATQIGSANARAVHPVFLLRMERFVAKLSRTKFNFRNPYLFTTKAEMCRDAHLSDLVSIAAATFSCDGFPIRVEGKSQCGTCSSCLLRRLSLQAAGLEGADSGGHYLRDLANLTARPRRSSLRAFRAMEWQIAHLRECLAAGSPWSYLAKAFPQLDRAAAELAVAASEAESVIHERLIRLYSTYVDEWTRFSVTKAIASAHGTPQGGFDDRARH